MGPCQSAAALRLSHTPRTAPKQITIVSFEPPSNINIDCPSEEESVLTLKRHLSFMEMRRRVRKAESKDSVGGSAVKNSVFLADIEEERSACCECGGEGQPQDIERAS
jgi:hypothetical protein